MTLDPSQPQPHAGSWESDRRPGRAAFPALVLGGPGLMPARPGLRRILVSEAAASSSGVYQYFGVRLFDHDK